MAVVQSGYYKDITLASASTISDAVVMLLIGASSGASGANFHIEGRAGFPTTKNDGGYLGFTNISTGAECPFWVESVASSVAKVWVKVGTLSSVRVWYGNASNNNLSNGNSTFRFFDDFDGGSVDGAKWSVSSGSASDTVSVAGSELAIISDATSPIKTVQSIGISSMKNGTNELTVHYRQRTTTMGNHNLGVGIMATNQADGNGQFFFRHVNPSTGNGDIKAYSRATGAWTNNWSSAAVWTYAEGATNWIHEMSGSTHKLYKGATQIGSDVTKGVGSGPVNLPRTAYIIMNRVWNEAAIDTGTFYYDWVFARQSALPTYSTATAEKNTASGNMLMMFM